MHQQWSRCGFACQSSAGNSMCSQTDAAVRYSWTCELEGFDPAGSSCQQGPSLLHASSSPKSHPSHNRLQHPQISGAPERGPRATPLPPRACAGPTSGRRSSSRRGRRRRCGGPRPQPRRWGRLPPPDPTADPTWPPPAQSPTSDVSTVAISTVAVSTVAVSTVAIAMRCAALTGHDLLCCGNVQEGPLQWCVKWLGTSGPHTCLVGGSAVSAWRAVDALRRCQLLRQPLHLFPRCRRLCLSLRMTGFTLSTFAGCKADATNIIQ